MSNAPKNPSRFCHNCGQSVTHPLAAGTAGAADSQSVNFCCRCGHQRNDDGTCGNNACDFFNEVPNCG
jgi:hypothetical protein